MIHPLLNADGDEPESPSRHSVKRLLFDWSSVAALMLAAMTWATLSVTVSRNSGEIDRLRAANDASVVSDLHIAADMATKADVREVRDQVTALARELREARSK